MSRRIHEIKHLPISELTDEEITKAAMYRLRAQGIVLTYMDEDGGAVMFYRWKNKNGKTLCDALKYIWKEKVYPERCRRVEKQKHITNK